MNTGCLIFSQVTDLLDRKVFQRCMALHPMPRASKAMTDRDQFLAMAFAQITFRESLRDIEACLQGSTHLYAMGIRGNITRTNLAYANEHRDWRVYEALPQAFFVIRFKINTRFYVLESRPVDKTTGLRSAQIIRLNTRKAKINYPKILRRVTYVDTETRQRFSFLTNNFFLPALTVAAIYKSRWQIELFFKWTKQNLRIKAFYGTSENAVCTQIWIAICVYLMVACLTKVHGIDEKLSRFLQILSANVFQKTPIDQLLTNSYTKNDEVCITKQLLFNGFKLDTSDFI
jgi:hypothetical protein